jgi:hypothetical protein
LRVPRPSASFAEGGVLSRHEAWTAKNARAGLSDQLAHWLLTKCQVLIAKRKG